MPGESMLGGVMMGDADSVRFMLRAEVRCAGQTLISSGTEFSEHKIFVVTDWHPPIDTAVSVRLSFPKLVEPVELAARVSGVRTAGNPGEPGGIVLAFEDRARAAAAVLAARVRRLCASARLKHAEATTYRVLLVEDNALIRDMFTFGMMRSFQPPSVVTIEHAEDAARAWGKLGEARYDLVIVDFFLP